MNKLSYLIVFILAISILPSCQIFAQESASSGYNPNSLDPIHENDIMWQKKIWRRIDLREKQNEPFFAFNNEITKIIIDAVKAGVLYPYQDDSLKTRMSKEEFLTNLRPPDAGDGLTEEEKAAGFGEEDGWGEDKGEDSWGEDKGEGEDAWGTEPEADPASNEYLPDQISLLELVEDMIFDRKRSRLYYDIQAITLILPADLTPTGLEKPIASFKYVDLANLFRSMPEEAIWFNPYNSAEHKNLVDAFKLRLFSSRIIKVANPRNRHIIDIYGGDAKRSIYASQEMEQTLMEKEHEVWEF